MVDEDEVDGVHTVPLVAYEAFVNRSCSVLRTVLIGFGAVFLVMAGTIAFLIAG